MWVPPVPDKKGLDDDERSTSGESSASRRSPLIVVSSGKRVLENEVPLHFTAPRGYGDRATRVQVRFNERTGLKEISGTEDGDEMLTGGGDGRNLRVRSVIARSWFEGEKSDEDTGIEDLDDQLFPSIDSNPPALDGVPRPQDRRRQFSPARALVSAFQDIHAHVVNEKNRSKHPREEYQESSHRQPSHVHDRTVGPRCGQPILRHVELKK